METVIPTIHHFQWGTTVRLLKFTRILSLIAKDKCTKASDHIDLHTSIYYKYIISNKNPAISLAFQPTNDTCVSHSKIGIIHSRVRLPEGVYVYIYIYICCWDGCFSNYSLELAINCSMSRSKNNSRIYQAFCCQSIAIE